MAVIGIYDSGIGGLTTMRAILNKFMGNDVYYYADNLRGAFGNMSEETLAKTVFDGLATLQRNSDITVIGCNTASTLLFYYQRGALSRDNFDRALRLPMCETHSGVKPIFGLLPQIYSSDPLSNDAADTLLLATEGTLGRIAPPDGMKIAHTPKLASLIEAKVARGLDMSPLLSYLNDSISQFVGVKRVILGCSHYPFVKREISVLLGKVKFDDGNSALTDELGAYLSPRPDTPSKITFAFSGENEKAKYDAVARALINNAKYI